MLKNKLSKAAYSLMCRKLITGKKDNKAEKIFLIREKF